MIMDIINWLNSLNKDITYGQLSDSPDSIINANVIDSGNKMFYDSPARLLQLSVLVRDVEYTKVISKADVMSEEILNSYGTVTGESMIVNITKTDGTEAERDFKNRYFITMRFEILIDRKEI